MESDGGPSNKNRNKCSPIEQLRSNTYQILCHSPETYRRHHNADLFFLDGGLLVAGAPREMPPSPRKKSNPRPPRHLPEGVIADILSRLPGKYVLRFRAVCQAWRRITTDPHFLATHTRRRPLELVFCTLLEQRPFSEDGQDGYSRDLAFNSIPVTAADPADQRRLIRYPGYFTVTPSRRTNFGPGNFPIASCAGVFLFPLPNREYAICNPVTRQWTKLPQPPKRGSFACCLYFHRSSDEYRFLCGSRYYPGKDTEYYIISTRGTEPRLLIRNGDEATNEMIKWICLSSDYITPVVLRDRLHWMPLSSTSTDRKIIAFDTVAEMFYLMPAPSMSSKCAKLFEMNKSLAAANFGETRIDLWFLEDYDTREWVRRHQIVTPPALKVLGDPQEEEWMNNSRRITAVSDDVEEVVLGYVGFLMVYNVRTKMVRGLDFVCEESEHYLSGPRFLFRESLMPLAARSSAGHPLVQFG